MAEGDVEAGGRWSWSVSALSLSLLRANGGRARARGTLGAGGDGLRRAEAGSAHAERRVSGVLRPGRDGVVAAPGGEERGLRARSSTEGGLQGQGQRARRLELAVLRAVPSERSAPAAHDSRLTATHAINPRAGCSAARRGVVRQEDVAAGGCGWRLALGARGRERAGVSQHGTARRMTSCASGCGGERV